MTFIFKPRFLAPVLCISSIIFIAGVSTVSHAGTFAAKQSASAPKAFAPTPKATSPTGTILEVADAAGQFSTFVAAIGAAGLTDRLNGDGPFTVFAPSDAAFGKLPAGTVENLLMPNSKAKLAAILSYHVIVGRIASTDLAGLTSTPATVQGATLSVNTRAGIKIGGATVTTPDVAATNGIIHVIDTVLIPPNP
jgi:uncharacterized surface protein with fasciclin (FAS1) repeats